MRAAPGGHGALGRRRGRSLGVARVVRAELRRRGLLRRACGLVSLVPRRTLCERLRERVRGHADGADTIRNGNYWVASYYARWAATPCLAVRWSRRRGVLPLAPSTVDPPESVRKFLSLGVCRLGWHVRVRRTQCVRGVPPAPFFFPCGVVRVIEDS